jgi:hypothetical protein
MACCHPIHAESRAPARSMRRSVPSSCPIGWQDSRRSSTGDIKRWSYWPPMDHSVSASWLACGATASMSCTAPSASKSRRIRIQWANACDKAGITGLHFHDLRGSGATWAATTEATAAELMARLGHTTPQGRDALSARHDRAGPVDRRQAWGTDACCGNRRRA